MLDSFEIFCVVSRFLDVYRKRSIFVFANAIESVNGENYTFLKMKQNYLDEKFVLTSFDRIAPSERQESVLCSFNFRVSE